MGLSMVHLCHLHQTTVQTAAGTPLAALQQLMYRSLNIDNERAELNQDSIDLEFSQQKRALPVSNQRQIGLLRSALLMLKLATLTGAAKQAAVAASVMWMSLRFITRHLQTYSLLEKRQAETEAQAGLNCDDEPDEELFLSVLITQVLMPALRQHVQIAAPQAEVGCLLLVALVVRRTNPVWQGVAAEVIKLGEHDPHQLKAKHGTS